MIGKHQPNCFHTLTKRKRRKMATSEHPITRSEMREELRHYATKEDLANLKWQLAVFLVALVSVLLGILEFRG